MIINQSSTLQTNLIIETKWSLVISVLTDVRLAQGGKVKIAPFLGVEDNVTAIGRVRKIFVGLNLKS
jgi:hypothetical protein